VCVCFEREGGKVLVLLLIGRIPGAPFAAPLSRCTLQKRRAAKFSRPRDAFSHRKQFRKRSILSRIKTLSHLFLIISPAGIWLLAWKWCAMRFRRSSHYTERMKLGAGEFSGLFQGNRSRSEIDLFYFLRLI
jgi:hypothetical protein